MRILCVVIGMVLSVSAFAQAWEGQGEAGFIKASGNTDSENINLGLELNKNGQAWSNYMALSAYRATNDNTDSANSIEAEYLLKRALTERSNVFFNLSYLDDEFDGFTEQTGVALGYGYKVYDSKLKSWETSIGLGYRDYGEIVQVENPENGQFEARELSVGGTTVVMRSQFSAQLTDNTEFVDDFKAEIGADNSFVQNQAALIVKMNERFSLKAELVVRHNTEPALGSDDTDTISILSLVYSFGGE